MAYRHDQENEINFKLRNKRKKMAYKLPKAI